MVLLKILAFGDSYITPDYFERGLAGLESQADVQVLTLDEQRPFVPSTPSEQRIREYAGSPEQLVDALTDQEVLVVHSTGLVTPFYGRARNLTSWEMETWALVRTETAPAVERSTRLYGVVRGDLAFVDEREYVDHAMAPYASAQLSRIAG